MVYKRVMRCSDRMAEVEEMVVVRERERSVARELPDLRWAQVHGRKGSR